MGERLGIVLERRVAGRRTGRYVQRKLRSIDGEGMVVRMLLEARWRT